MSTTVSAGAQDASRIDDHDAIRAVLELYVQGAGSGDPETLREAFHEDARLFGAVGGQRFDIPLPDFIALVQESPGDVQGSLRARVTSITQVGDAAAAVVAEDGFWGHLSFVDFFNLTRLDGRWRIADKTFAHTGGAMPG